MTISGKTLGLAMALATTIACRPASAQIDLPPTAVTAGKDAPTAVTAGKDAPTAMTAAKDARKEVETSAADLPLRLRADLSARKLYVVRGDSTFRVFDVAVGQPRYPTPPGDYTIKKIVWNPSWHPPPGSAWAKGKTAKGPGDPGNPMKVVKIFFKEPDYYIHGTDDLESLGSAESHGCLRMDPDEVASLAKLIMEHGGAPRGENWFWRVLHFRRQEQVVYLDNPVSLSVTP